MWHFCLFFLYSSYKCVGVMLKENDYRRRLSKSYFYPWLSLTNIILPDFQTGTQMAA